MIDGVTRVAAFCAVEGDAGRGGNPAGVWTGAVRVSGLARMIGEGA